MIKVTITIYTSDTYITTREDVYVDVTTIDSDDYYLRIITGDGSLIKIKQSELLGYTAEVVR